MQKRASYFKLQSFQDFPLSQALHAYSLTDLREKGTRPAAAKGAAPDPCEGANLTCY